MGSTERQLFIEAQPVRLKPLQSILTLIGDDLPV
jgi:hypothetical protein